MYGKKINRERLEAMRSRKDVLVADVRTPEHFRDGSIKGSINLYPARNFVNRLQTIKNKKQPIVIVSYSTSDEDVRVNRMYAERFGFENVYTADFTALRDD